jgi:RNA-directed DNA polymerase
MSQSAMLNEFLRLHLSMQKLEELRSIKSVSGLAELLKFKPSALTFLLHKLPADQKYQNFSIPKRSGGIRQIAAPTKQLKLLQKRVSRLLNACLGEIEKDFPSPAHGFKIGRTIFTNAAQHCKRRYVFNIDLEEFFPSIHFGRVKGLLEKSDNFRLEPIVAKALANIICHESKLPQGAPSSPVVSNLIARMLDVHLARLAKRNRLTYTRYADDLTFSTNLRLFPQAVAKKVDAHKWECGEELVSIIKSCGFQINNKKTRMLYESSRQEVTGLVVNDRVSVPAEYRRWARAAVSMLIKTGNFFEQPLKKFIGPPLAKPKNGSLKRLEGALSYIYSAHKFRRAQNKKGLAASDANEDLHSDEQVYRKFLYYSKFYLAEKPIIVCEGETDVMYLQKAMVVFGENYPDLIDAALEKGDDHRFKVKFAKHNDVASRILNLHGGTDALKHFCRIYVEQTKKFIGGVPSSPAVIIVDADKAGNDVFNYAKGIAKKQGSEEKDSPDFIFVKPNIYVLLIPNSKGEKESVVENLFPANFLQKTLDGKTLTLTNNKAGQKEFGKMYFAKYILPTAVAADLEEFKPLLNKLVAVINDFSVKSKPAAKINN